MCSYAYLDDFASLISESLLLLLQDKSLINFIKKKGLDHIQWNFECKQLRTYAYKRREYLLQLRGRFILVRAVNETLEKCYEIRFPVTQW